MSGNSANLNVVLFRNLEEDGSFSMRRYSAELAQALRGVAGSAWEIREFGCRQPSILAKLSRNRMAHRVDNAVARYGIYPWRAWRVGGDLFHICDHGYAHLGAALPPHRTVVTCHDLIPLLARAGAIPVPIQRHVAWTVWLRLQFMRRAARIIADSQATKDSILRFFRIPEERVVVVPLAVNPHFCPSRDPDAKDHTRRSLRVPPDARVILHVGTRGPYKNTPALLRAVHLMNSSWGLNVVLLRVGAPFTAEENLLIDACGLSGRVLYVARAGDDEVLASLYRAADVFAFPSLWEGFGWPVLEAMACGVPVVASNVSSLPEVVGEAGYLVEPTDHHQLATAIARLLRDDPQRQEFVCRGLDRARRFSWQRTAERTLQVYEQVLRGCSASDRSGPCAWGPRMFRRTDSAKWLR